MCTCIHLWRVPGPYQYMADVGLGEYKEGTNVADFALEAIAQARLKSQQREGYDASHVFLKVLYPCLSVYP